MGLFDVFRKERKALNPNSTQVTPINGLLTPLPINYQQDRAYETMSAVYTVVTFLMQKFATVPIRVYKVQDEESLKQYKKFEPYMFQRPANYLKGRKLQKKALEQADESSDLAKLLQNPNPNMDSDTFFMTLFGFHLLKGEGFIWGNRGFNQGDKNAPVLEMYPLPPGLMHLVPDPNDVYGILQWVIQLPKLTVLPVEDVRLWRMPRFDFDPTTHIHLRGQSPLTAGKPEMDGISALNEAYKATYLYRGAQGMIATQDPQMSFEEMQRGLKAINERFNTQTGDRIGGFNGVNPQFFDMSMSAADLALLEAKKYSLTQIAQLYNAPQGIWDLSESANNNITQYRAQVFTDVLMPKWSTLLSILNSWLLPAFNMPGYYIAADYSEVPDLQADIERMLSTYKDAWEITPNEKRELKGFEEMEDALMDTPWVPSGYKPLADAALNIDDLQNDMDGTTTINSQDRE